MDEKIKSTINKIKLLAEQNPEFNQAMQKLFGETVSASVYSNYDTRISHIEKYLGLDYYVDNQPSLIDYDFIQEIDVRDRLISDNREMMRFRYGTRYHSINFEEFCRYAHLQVEMLLNYFYDKKNNGIGDIVCHIKKHNPTVNLENIKSLGNISHNAKLWAFKTEFKLDYNIYLVLDYLRRIRNEASHRSPETEQKSIHDYKKQLINMGLPLRQDGEVDFFKLEDGSTKYKLYKSMVYNKDWYKDYRYLIWLHSEPYDRVVDAIEHLNVIIKTNS